MSNCSHTFLRTLCADAFRATNLDRAVLAYARWQGLEGETELQQDIAKAELDALILRMEPEEWNGLSEYALALGKPHIRELMSYSLAVAAADLDRQKDEVERLPEWTLDKSGDRTPDPEATPSRNRRRDREP